MIFMFEFKGQSFRAFLIFHKAFLFISDFCYNDVFPKYFKFFKLYVLAIVKVVNK